MLVSEIQVNTTRSSVHLVCHHNVVHTYQVKYSCSILMQVCIVAGGALEGTQWIKAKKSTVEKSIDASAGAALEGTE